LLGGWVGGGQIVIPMPEALSFAESRRQQVAFSAILYTIDNIHDSAK
jgi:hypothetical protein